MQFMFSGLILGDVMSALNNLNMSTYENTEKGEISRWENTFERDGDEIIMNIDIPVTNNAPYEDLIGMTDGIIYYLNPMMMEDVELFKELIEIINNYKRNIPTVVILHDPDEIITINANEILSWIWEEYPFESWIYHSEKQNPLGEVIPSLIDSIIESKEIINHDTAWLQIPVLKRKANELIEEEYWLRAAQIVEKISLIYKKRENINWTIYAEKAAWLYTQARNFLASSKVISDFNKTFSDQYLIMHGNEMINNAQELFKNQLFADAAQQYEVAAQWTKLEVEDEQKVTTIYKSAILSWISACDIPKALLLLENFDINGKSEVLNEYVEKIAGAADFLSSEGQHEIAKSYLYLSLHQYQETGLFDGVKILANKGIKILKIILSSHIKNNDPNSGTFVIDEIENLWATYNAKKEDIDDYISRVVELFIKQRDFSKVDEIIQKITSTEMKQDLTEIRMAEEEYLKEETKDDEELYQKEAVETLLKYVKNESKDIYNMNERTFAQAKLMKDNGNSLKATTHIKNQASWLKFIGKENLSFDVFEHIFKIYLEALLIGQFTREIMELPDQRRKKILLNCIDDISICFNNLEHKLPVEKYEELIKEIISIYRNHLLYEEGKIFSEQLISRLIAYGADVASTKEHKSILNAINLIFRIQKISKSYLDGKKFDMDDVYKHIVEYYISIEKYVDARKYADNLMDKEKSRHYYEEMDSIESKKTEKITHDVHKKQEMEIYAETLSHLQKKSTEQIGEQENLMRMRNGLKRHYFEKGLVFLRQNNPGEATKIYIDTTKKLVKSKKIELGAITLAAAFLFDLSLKKTQNVKIAIQHIDEQFGVSKDLFHSTFAVSIIDYVHKMLEANKPEYIKHALKLFKVLAFFPEEQLLLSTLIGEKGDVKPIIDDFESLIQINKDDVVKSSKNYKIWCMNLKRNPSLYSKRISLERKYWTDCQDFLTKQQYNDAYQEYTKVMHDIINRTEKEFTIISMMMAFFSLMKNTPIYEVKKKYDKLKFKLERDIKNQNVEFKELYERDELKLFNYFLDQYAFFRNNGETSANKKELYEIVQKILSDLVLFDWEKSFIKNITVDIQPNSKKVCADDDLIQTISTVSDACQDDDDVLLNDQVIVLVQEIAGMKEQFVDMKCRRERMVRTYYQPILDSLQSGDFKSANKQYFALVKRMSRRNNFESASLMIVLGGLSLLKAGLPLDEIREKHNELLGGLGHVKNILNDTFGVKILNLIIYTREINDTECNMYILDILRALPLLETEEVLYDI